MQIVKDNRLYRERKELLGRRLPVLRRAFSTYESQFSFSQRQSFISTAELFLEPPIQDLIFNFPDDVILTEAHILPTLTNIVPGANRRLRLQIEEQLFQIVQKAYRKRGDDSTIDRTVLNLATTVFNCRDCDQQPFLSVEEAIMHLCTRNRYFPEGYRDKSSIRSHLGNQFRSHQSLTVHVKGADGVTQLIKVCGLDPLTTTKQTMDELNPIFECIKCYLYSLEGRSMGSWATMVGNIISVIWCVWQFLKGKSLRTTALSKLLQGCRWSLWARTSDRRGGDCRSCKNGGAEGPYLEPI